MKGVFLIVFFSFMYSNLVLGQSISQEYAYEIANKILAELNVEGTLNEFDSISNVAYSPIEEAEKAIYIFNDKNGGFVIISADKRNYPILAYSDQSSIPENRNDWPPSFKSWIETIELYVDSLQKNGSKASSELMNMWEQLEDGVPVLSLKSEGDLPLMSSVEPLLSTTWNQGCGYNALCPVAAGGPCGRVYTGCVATAMAQVMRYMEHPETGSGSYCYTTSNYGELCVDFSDGVYDYGAMTSSSGNSHVAKLMYHCGIAVRMNYSPTGSGAYSSNVVRAWKDYFGYKNAVLIQKSNYTEANWINILKNEINNSRPLYYAGYSSSSGHAFVLDGYNDSDFFHVNWGWGGSANGYFHVSAMGNYSSGQQTIVGAIPATQFSNLDFSEVVSLTCATPVRGDISTGNDYINYYKNTYPTAVGKELVYTFTTDLPGRVRIKVSNNIGGNVNVFLLSHSHQDSLLAYGLNGLTIDNTQAGVYYVAIEGVNKAEPVFDVEVICPTIEADLIFTSASVRPEFVESLYENAIFTSTIANIGNTDASSCTIDYYLSEDDTLNEHDIYIGSDIIPPLNAGESKSVVTQLSMPDNLSPGYMNVIFVADSINIVPESDDDNVAMAYVQVPEPGIMDCNSAVILQNGVWHLGNTQSDGINNIEKYGGAIDMTGPEVIHTFTPQYNGFAKVTFSEKEPGLIQAIILPICNENTYLSGVWFNSITDTVGVEYVYVSAGTQYYVVVDGLKGESGNYALKVDLPEECPDVSIEVSGNTNLCEGDYFPSMWTRWGANTYQWFINGEAIPEATESWFQPNSAGAYHLEITENGCSGVSEVVNIAMSIRPDTAQITSLGDLSFCNGGSVELSLANTVSFPMNWALNGELIDGATEPTYQATQAGIYTLVTTNSSCSISSENSIEVETKPLPVNIGEKLPVPSGNVFFNYTFDEGNTDLSGNNNYFYCNNFEPINDRFDNFWKARHYTNNDVVAYVSNRHELPDEFTLSLWFKTSSNSGGVISGLVDSPWNATQMEAMLYMDNDGKLHFYMSNGGVPAELVSINSYNNNQWHNVLIRYNGNMRMSINNGSEVLQNLNTITKLNFLAYWVFAGPNLPDNVLDMPSSKFFDGAIDDILCVYESNNYIEKFNYSSPHLALQLVTDEANSCSDPMVQIEIINSQPGINYRIWDETNSQWYSDPVSGNIENITIAGNYEIDGATDFKIYAINDENNCELILDTIILAVPNTKVLQQPLSQNLCVGENLSLSVIAHGDMLTYQWKHGDDNLGVYSNELFIENIQFENLGEYSVNVSGTCGDTISDIAIVDFSPVWAISTHPFNSNYCEGDETTQSVILNNQNECFNANEYITVAGGGQTFSAETGSWTTFIAGKSIKFFPGFIAEAGSYVNAYITTEGIFCDDILIPQSTTVSSPVIEKSIETIGESVVINNLVFDEKQIKIYPNPNNGSFYVQLVNFEKETKISICNIMGKQVYQSIIFENTKSNINVPYLPAGLYYISANDSKTVKSIKMVVK